MEKICCQITIAALMQPLQYDLYDVQLQKTIIFITHSAAAPNNLDAAITMHFAASRGQHASLYADGNRTRQQSCSHYTAICNQRIKKRKGPHRHEQPLVAEHRGGTDSTLKRPQPHPPHTRATFHRRLRPLYTENHKVSCSGFPPNTSPLQHLCSHYIAICNQRANKRIESGRHEQSLVAEHRGETESTLKRPQPHPPCTRATCHRRLQPLCTKKNKVSCSGFPPNTAPCNIHAAITQAMCNPRVKSIVSHFQLVSTHTPPPFMEYSLTLLIVMWCKFTHYPLLSIVSHFSLLCDVNSHTTLHWVRSHTFNCDVM